MAGPGGSIPAACERIAASTWFNVAMFGVIVANAVTLGAETYPSVERDHSGTLDALDTVWLTLFVIELAIRVTAYAPRLPNFFRDGWNVFDFVVVAAAFVPGLRENATLLRLARLARIVRVVRLLPDLRILVLAVVRSIPATASLLVLAVLVLYLFGMVGHIAFGDAYPEEYGDIGEAMLTLFITLTLENLPDQIDIGRDVGGGWGILFFISYALIAAFLLFNILIGIVITSMEEAREIETRRDREERGDLAADALEDKVAAMRVLLDELESDLMAKRRPPR